VYEDRLPSLEQGLRAGYSYASTYNGDPVKLRNIARAHTAADVAANIDPALIEPDGISDAVAFWSGFAHGVARFLIDERTALLAQSPNG
jgi:hypothetical protein